MPPHLDRFLAAQAPVYAAVIDELRRGRKATHWMWFVFPQLVGLGRSEMSRRFGISSLDEARDYLAHPILGARLRECCGLVLVAAPRSAEQIFGPIDAMKLRSCVTLFHRAAPAEPVFSGLLERFFEGAEDEATLDLLRTDDQTN